MNANFPNHRFVCGNLDLPFVIEAKVDEIQITLRTWTLSKDATISSVISIDEAVNLYGCHAQPFDIRSGLASGNNGKSWIPLEALKGRFFGGSRSQNLYLKLVSEMGFLIERDIIGRAAWSDYAVWAFNCSRDGMLSMPFNRYIETQSSKQHRNMLLISRKEINLMTVNVAFAENRLSDCSLVLKYNPKYGCVHNFNNFKEMPVNSVGFGIYDMERFYGVKALLPSLRLSGPDTIEAERTGHYTVEMYSKNTDSLVDDVEAKVYLESNSGYLPHRQVIVRNGVARFPLYALGLSAGDQIKLKVGWRNYTGADEKIITIV